MVRVVRLEGLTATNALVRIPHARRGGGCAAPTMSKSNGRYGNERLVMMRKVPLLLAPSHLKLNPTRRRLRHIQVRVPAFFAAESRSKLKRLVGCKESRAVRCPRGLQDCHRRKSWQGWRLLAWPWVLPGVQWREGWPGQSGVHIKCWFQQVIAWSETQYVVEELRLCVCNPLLQGTTLQDISWL